MHMAKNFEKLIEYIINDEKEKAQELFHQYVVETSRDIYNDLVAEEDEDSEDNDKEMSEYAVNELDADQTDDMMSDISADEEGMEMDGMSDEMDDDMGDEMSDDGMDDEMSDDDMGGEGDEGIEDRVMDLEDELEALKAEFEKLMSDEESEDKAEEGVVREYKEKVNVSHSDGTDSKGSKSPVAGKNDMGGSAKNIAQGGEEKGANAPKSGHMGVVDPRAAGKTAFNKKAPAPVAKDQATGTKSPVA